MSAHTPGPWMVEMRPDTAGVGRPVVASANGDLICAVSRRDGRAESGDNARLLAAAPDLLAACEWAPENCRALTGGDERRLRAAIAKARGDL